MEVTRINYRKGKAAEISPITQNNPKKLFHTELLIIIHLLQKNGKTTDTKTLKFLI